MANLFVVFTPLQVVIAQQIIVQEKLVDNVMLESFFPGYSHFLEIYQIIRNDELWSKIIPFANWASWDYEGIQILKHFSEVRKNSKEIITLLQANSIETLYLADFQNQTNRFTCFWLTKLGYKVVFFEEGYSHYIPRVASPPSDCFAHSVYERLLDWCYYLPFYHIKFAKWRCYPNMDYHGLPMHLRYSIIPGIHHESYDRQLHYTPMMSSKLQKYIDEEIDNITKEKILLLTDPMTEVLQPQYKHLYFDTIQEVLSDDSNRHIFIKFHPRDSKDDREKTIYLMKSLGCRFTILGKRINIPVEFYLESTKFSEVLFFNTSTYFYNGYLFPKTTFVKLLPILHQKCLEHHASDLRQMELLLARLNDKEKCTILESSNG